MCKGTLAVAAANVPFSNALRRIEFGAGNGDKVTIRLFSGLLASSDEFTSESPIPAAEARELNPQYGARSSRRHLPS